MAIPTDGLRKKKERKNMTFSRSIKFKYLYIRERK